MSNPSPLFCPDMSRRFISSSPICFALCSLTTYAGSYTHIHQASLISPASLNILFFSALWHIKLYPFQTKWVVSKNQPSSPVVVHAKPMKSPCKCLVVAWASHGCAFTAFLSPVLWLPAPFEREHSLLDPPWFEIEPMKNPGLLLRG